MMMKNKNMHLPFQLQTRTSPIMGKKHKYLFQHIHVMPSAPLLSFLLQPKPEKTHCIIINEQPDFTSLIEKVSESVK